MELGIVKILFKYFFWADCVSGGAGSAAGTLAARHAATGRPEIAGKVNMQCLILRYSWESKYSNIQIFKYKYSYNTAIIKCHGEYDKLDSKYL